MQHSTGSHLPSVLMHWTSHIKRGKKQFSSTQGLMLQWNFEKACQLRWHGNSYCSTDTTEAQGKGIYWSASSSKCITQNPPKSCMEKQALSLLWRTMKLLLCS